MSSLSDQFAADSASIGDTPSKPKSISQQFADDANSVQENSQNAKPIQPSSILDRVGTGAADFVHKSAQLISHVFPDFIAEPGRKFNNAAADWIPGIAKIPEGGIDQMVNDRENEYQAQRKAAGSTGFDWARLAGNLVNPANFIPGAGQANLLKSGAIGAAAAVSSTPTTGDDQDNFWLNQAKLASGGAVFGSAAQGVANAASPFVSAGMKKLSSLLPKSANDISQDAGNIVGDALNSKGIDPSSIAPEIQSRFKNEVQKSLDANITPEPRTLQNYVEAQSLPVPVPILRGQASRDPMTYAKEMNLRGINGVGEPITNVMTAQNRALIDNLDQMGAGNAPNIVDAGQKAIDTLKSIDDQARASVTDAYNKFKNATGKSLDVPLQGVAQDYARIAHEYGMSTLPEGVRNQLNSLGLMSGNQMKTFGIDDAENILKVINKNYDSSNRPQASALDELRRSIQGAITQGSASDNLGGQAAQLAQNARALAAKRFQLIDSVPAYKAAISDAAPDKFLQKYFWNGNAGDIANMKSLINSADPQALNSIKSSVLGDIKQSTLNNQSSDNGIFSQAKFNGIVRDQNNSKRIGALFEPDEASLLSRIGNVAENVMLPPKASAVNSSNTSSSAANLVKAAAQGGSGAKLLSLLGKGNIAVVSPVAQALADKAGKTSLADMVNSAASPLSVNDLNALKYFTIPAALGGYTTGSLKKQN